MIYLTGDVHAPIKNDWEQKKAGSELDAAKTYLEILNKHKIKSTIFMNGISVKKEKQKVRELLNYDVEIGGHTYNNFDGIGIIKSYIYRKIFKCVYGPKSYQKKDIKKTKQVFEDAGLKLDSWRTHAFASNDLTFKILKKGNISYVSDFLGNKQAFEKDKIIHVPINIPVDNNTIAYGMLVPENRNPLAGCTKGRITKEEWFEILKKRVAENEKKGKDSVLLIHPISMKVLDNFETFEKIAKFLSKYKSGKICEIEV